MLRVHFREGPTALSERARKAFQLAHQEAQRLNHQAVGAEHLLVGLAKEALSPAAVLLRQFGFNFLWLRGEVERVSPLGDGTIARPGALPYNLDLQSFLEALVAAAEATGVTPLT